MQLFTPQECTANYAAAGRAKARMPFLRMFLLAVLAGFLIGMGGAVTNTAARAWQGWCAGCCFLLAWQWWF